MNAKRNHLIAALLAGCCVLGSASAGKEAASDAASTRAKLSIALVEELMSDPQTALPDALLEHARAVAVFPELDRGDGPNRGNGLIAHRLETGGWSAPVFVRLAGMQRTDASEVVLVFTDDAQLGALVESELKLGANSDIAAGPLGSGAQAGDLSYESSVYSYVRDGDVFVGMALDEISLAIDTPSNRAIYGEDFDARSCLTQDSASAPEELVGFEGALKRRPNKRS